MLQSIRDRSQGWLAGAIIGLVCLTFALFGIHSYVNQGSGTPDVAAKINGQAIEQNDLNSAYQRLRQQEQAQEGADFIIDQKMELQLKKQALNQIIMTRVLSQAALKEGYRVTPSEVGAALLSIPVFQVDGQFSRDRFNEVLSNILYTETGFLTDLQTTMLINQVRSGLVDSAFTLPSEINKAVNLVNQKRDIAYLIIPASRFANNINISNDQALGYYNQHQKEFSTPEQVSIDYIKLSLPELAAHMHFTDEQLTQFYQNNLDNFTKPQQWHVAHIFIKIPANATSEQVTQAQAKAENIAERARSGEDFATLARNDSDDTASAQNGGVLDWYSSGMIDPVFEKAVSSLTQPGDISTPVRTKYGFNVIKLLDVQKPQILPFAKVHDQVEKALAEQQAEQQFSDASDKLSNLTYTNPASLEAASKSLGLQVQTSDLFTREGGKDQITANPKVMTAAFMSDVLQGNNSDVIELSPDTLVVLRIKQHVPANIQSFADVKIQVTQELKAELVKQQTQAFGQKLLQELQQGKNADQVAKQATLYWSHDQNCGRFANHIPAIVLNAAFRMPRPESNIPSSDGFSLPNGDYALLQLNAVHDGSLDKNANVQQRIYREELGNTYGQLDYTLYVRGLINKAKINISQNSDNSNTAPAN